MRHHIPFLHLGIFLLVLATALAGCAARSNIGRNALPQHVLPANTTTAGGEWQTNDLRILYTVEDAGDSFTVDGTVRIKDSITYSFPRVEFLNITINYLDADGVVLSSHDVSPVTGYNRPVAKSLSLRNVPAAPVGATSFTFNYWGTFIGGSNRDENTGEWEIYFNPFENGR